jgi:RNA polymerase sigma-70 factor, ECF subfamily
VTRDVAAARDDGDIATRIAAGDEAAFVIAYERHVGLVFGSLVRFLGDREAAAEVVQDSFLALWRRARQFDPSAGSLPGWLLGIARHRAIDRLRGEARRPSSHSVALEQAEDLRAPTDPAAVADRRWLQSVVQTAVAELPGPERDVLVLAYAEGLSQADIADRLAIPLGTVKSRTRRAMARVRGQLEALPGWTETAGDALSAGPR